MNFELGLIASATLIVITVAAFAALISKLTFPSALMWLKRLAPSTRSNLLWIWAMLPLLLGLAALFIVLLPSMFHFMGIATDHCLEHVHHAHLCLVHSPAFVGNPLELLVLGSLALVTFRKLSRIGASIIRDCRTTSMLNSMSIQPSNPEDHHVLTSNRVFAFTIGLFRPLVFVSSRLTEVLDHKELLIVLSHEDGHRLRRDGLRKLSARILASAHFQTTRQTLLAELELATEQSCDEHAAGSLDDRLSVAETILKLSRLASMDHIRGDSVSAFNASDCERRIEGLLNPPIPRNRYLSAIWMVILCVLSVSGLMSADFWHHITESLFGIHLG